MCALQNSAMTIVKFNLSSQTQTSIFIFDISLSTSLDLIEMTKNLQEKFVKFLQNKIIQIFQEARSEPDKLLSPVISKRFNVRIVRHIVITL